MPLRRIECGKGGSALVDEEDFDLVSQYRWFSWYNRNTWYAGTKIDYGEYARLNEVELASA